MSNACAVVAQGADEAHRCVFAAQRLAETPTRDEYGRLLSTLVTCPTEGPEAIAQAWRDRALDSARARVLGDVSAVLRDSLVFGAVDQVARDVSRPRDVRLGALRALIGLADPRLDVWFRNLDRRDIPSRMYVGIAEREEGHSWQGAKPLGADTKAAVLAILREIARTRGGEPVVAAIADELVARLSQR